MSDKLKPSLPWVIRQHPTLPSFIQATEFAKAKGMPYALEVFGEDYNGFGGDEQRQVDMEYAVMASMAHEGLAKALLDVREWLLQGDVDKSFLEPINAALEKAGYPAQTNGSFS